MFQVSSDDHNIVISGDFWELDNLYFGICRFIGDFGTDHTCAFPGYEDVCKRLLGLNYEIRKAQHGDYELFFQHNMVREEWFSPVGYDPAKDITPETFDIKEYEEDLRVFGYDPEELEDMDENERSRALEEESFDPDEFEDYLTAKYYEPYKFRREDYPSVPEDNILFRFQLSYSEGLFYALILNELLGKKDLSYAEWQKRAEKSSFDSDGFYSARGYYLSGLDRDIARIQLFVSEVFTCIHVKIGSEKFAEFKKEVAAKPDGFLNCDLKKVIKYVEDNRDTEINENCSNFIALL